MIVVTIEGVDGSGKTTIAQALYEYLSNQNDEAELSVVLVHEPGYTDAGRRIYDLIVNVPMPEEARMLLFAADRLLTHRYVEALNPDIVISDRSVYSSYVYQGIVNEDHTYKVQTVYNVTLGSVIDLVIVLDVDYETSTSRLTRKANDKLDEEHIKNFSKIRNSFTYLAREMEENDFSPFMQVAIVDANRSFDEVLNDVISIVEELLE